MGDPALQVLLRLKRQAAMEREPRTPHCPPRSLGPCGTQLSLFTPSNSNLKCLQVSLHSYPKKIKTQTAETKPENQKSKG